MERMEKMERTEKTKKNEYAAPTAEITELSADVILISYGDDNEEGFGPLLPMLPSNPNRW